jgi:hypothetical protein
MDKELLLLNSKLDYHLFLYKQLTEQLSSIQKCAAQGSIESYESMLANETLRDALLLKFILFQRTIKKVGISTLESRYKMRLKSFPWMEAEYFDQNCVVHYDCVWSLLQDIKPLKRQIERIKKYDDTRYEEHGEDIHCSFCGKGQQEVERIIVGTHEAICNECVGLCSEILEEVTEEEKGKK